VQSSDDWNQSKTHWIGFESKPPESYDVARTKTSASDNVPICDCDKPKVKTDRCLGECDANGVITKPFMRGTVLWVIVQYNPKHVDYGLKFRRIAKHVRKKKGNRMSTGIYAMASTDASTPRKKIIEEFVEAGMLDDGDKVIVIDALGWNLFPEDYPKRRSSPPEFSLGPED
jgi:hypothetical protein